MSELASTRDSLALQQTYLRVRRETENLAASLSAEDQTVQSMDDASPIKWHLAHTAWFFEALVLQRWLPAYRPFDERFNYLFNSYYEGLGPRHPRPSRYLLTRPSVEEVLGNRRHVVVAIPAFLLEMPAGEYFGPLLALGLNHQHTHQ